MLGHQAGSGSPQPFAPAPHCIFRVLGSAHEKPAGVLGQERLKIDKIWLLTLRLAFDMVAPSSLGFD